MTESLQFFQVMSIILADGDREGWRVDGILFHSRSFNGDDDGLFELVAGLAKTMSSNAVIINGSDGEGFEPGGPPAWPGKDIYTARLRALGCEVLTSKPGKHTLEEAFTFSEYAQSVGWKRAIIIAQPFQLLRIMLTHLHVMEKRHYPMQIYPLAPKSVDWTKSTNCNQGRPGVPRFDQINAEFDRIRKYQKQGTLVTIPELIDYMLRGREALAP